MDNPFRQEPPNHHFDDSDVMIVDGYPDESLELQLKWMLEHNRPKDQKKIRTIRDYLSRRS